MSTLTMKDLDRLVAEQQAVWQGADGVQKVLGEILGEELAVEFAERMWHLLVQISTTVYTDEDDIPGSIQALALMSFMLGYEVHRQYG